MLHLETVAGMAHSLWLTFCGLGKRETSGVNLSGGSRDLSARRSVQIGNAVVQAASPMLTCVFFLPQG
jgi:hypothetical protein